MRVVVALTCHNRKNKTYECIISLVKGNELCDFCFVIVDDGSTDGTYEMLSSLENEIEIYTIRGDGQLYYSGGMRNALDYIIHNLEGEYVLLVNDDVQFREKSIDKIIIQSQVQENAVIVGTTCDNNNTITYGAVCYINNKYRKLDTDEWEKRADTFNANCVLIPFDVVKKIGSFDEHFIHSLGDFDYGMMISKRDYIIHPSKEYVGICLNNSKKGTWEDLSLKRIERIRKKESIKGAPLKQWFYYNRKHFGIGIAIRTTITPFIRILLGK